MVDNITLKRINLLHPNLIDEANQIYKDIYNTNIQVRFTSTLRTFQEQNILFFQGRESLNDVNIKRRELNFYELKDFENIKVTNAIAGKSFHNYGLAIDFCLLDKKNMYNLKYDMNSNNEADWMEVVKVFKSYGWEWGSEVNFKSDTPHFQKRFDYTIEQLYQKYLNKEFINNTIYLNL